MSSLPAHQVLARKWRPRDFDSLVGQDVVVRALRHALDNNRLHHAYLLTGTRGVGKTTIARIIAKALNCEQGVSSRPCGRCSACTGVDVGRFPDYVEMDAASNRRVEEMTLVLENAAYAPSIGRFKVFVIDEVHMLSAHAFNAMLKTLEEPPPHVVFVLATTDPQKVPVTVLSRCMQFGLRNMSATAVADHLARVLDAEGIEGETGALDAIGRAAAGSMRDALSLLDQAIALGAGKVLEASVREMLGAVDDQVVPQLLEHVIAADGAGLVALCDAMGGENAPFAQVLQTLARELQRIALAQVTDTLEHPLAARIAPEDVQVFYQVAIHGGRDLSLAPDPQTGFMMTMLRMLAFRSAAEEAGRRTSAPSFAPPSPASATGSAMAPSSAQPTAGPASSAAAAASAAAVAGGGREAARNMAAMLGRGGAAAARPAPTVNAAARAAPVAPTSAGREAAPGRPSFVQRPIADDRPVEGKPAVPMRAGSSTESGASAEPDAPLDFNGNWPELAAKVSVGGMARELLRQSELLSVSGSRFELRVPVRPLTDPQLVARATEALSQWFGRPIRLDVTLGDTRGADTAALRASDQRRQLEADAVEAIETDPFVRELISGFDATIVPNSIKPNGGESR